MAHEMPTSEGLLLFNAVLTRINDCGELSDFTELMEAVYYAAEGSCGNWVAFDALLVMGSVPGCLANPKIELVKEMFESFNAVVRNCSDLSILNIAVDALGETAFYCRG